MSGWRFRARKEIRLGPIFIVLASAGGRPRITSWGVAVGRIRHNITGRRTTIDTPGPGSVSRRWSR